MAKPFVSLKVEKTSRLLRRHPENVPRLGERQHQSGGQWRSENSLSSRRQRSGEGSRGQAARQRPQHPQLHHPPLLAQDKGTAGPPSIVWAILFSFSEKIRTHRMANIFCYFFKVESPQLRKSTPAGRSKSFSNHRPLEPEFIAQVDHGSQVGIRQTPSHASQAEILTQVFFF